MSFSGIKSLVAVFTLLVATSFFTACGQAVDPAYHNTAEIAGAWHITGPVAIPHRTSLQVGRASTAAL